ncbi:MAG: ABC transporter substrate-binding protein [Polyangiales bacterium]
MQLVTRFRIVSVLSCLALAGGCGKRAEAPTGTETRAAVQPAPGGELVFGFDGAAVAQFKLDPHESAFAPHHRVMRSIYDSLVVALPGHRFGPWLARSWEVAPDGLSYTFHLRDDVLFHDGTAFDAEAVRFNLDRIKDPKNAFLALADIGSYQRSEVIDPRTVRVHFDKPFAPFLANLSKSSLGMVSPAAVAKHGNAFPQNPVGTGPFRFVSLAPATEIVLARNPAYAWPPEGAAHQGPAFLERVTFKNVPEESTRVAVLMNGQAGAVDLIPPQNLVSLQKSPDYRLIQGELLNHNYALYLNVQRAPWTDARVREAFRNSLDLDTAVRTIYLGTQARAWSSLSPSIPGYDKSLENAWKPDREGAKRALEALGWKAGDDGVRVKDGKRLTVSFLDTQGNREKRLDLMTLLRRQLKDAGFDVRIDSQPSGAYLAKSAAGEFDLLAGSLFAPDPDVMRRIYSPNIRSQASVAKVDDPELTELLERGAQTLDPTERAALYARAQRLVLDKTYAIPAYVLKYNVASATRVQGIAIDVHGFPVLYDSWLGS